MLYPMKRDTVRPIDRADASDLRDKFALEGPNDAYQQVQEVRRSAPRPVIVEELLGGQAG